MKLIIDFIMLQLLKLFFYTKNHDNVTEKEMNKVSFNTDIKGKNYYCECIKIKYKTDNGIIIMPNHTSYLYKVTMYENNDNQINITQGSYPLLCSKYLLGTNYPEMAALRHHYNVTYK